MATEDEVACVVERLTTTNEKLDRIGDAIEGTCDERIAEALEADSRTIVGGVEELNRRLGKIGHELARIANALEKANEKPPGLAEIMKRARRPRHCYSCGSELSGSPLRCTNPACVAVGELAENVRAYGRPYLGRVLLDGSPCPCCPGDRTRAAKKRARRRAREEIVRALTSEALGRRLREPGTGDSSSVCT